MQTCSPPATDLSRRDSPQPPHSSATADDGHTVDMSSPAAAMPPTRRRRRAYHAAPPATARGWYRADCARGDGREHADLAPVTISDRRYTAALNATAPPRFPAGVPVLCPGERRCAASASGSVRCPGSVACARTARGWRRAVCVAWSIPLSYPTQRCVASTAPALSHAERAGERCLGILSWTAPGVGRRYHRPGAGRPRDLGPIAVTTVTIV
jgi:hypothetical protein